MTGDFALYLLSIAARTAIVLVFIVIGFRIFGKREAAQMNVYDLAFILAMSNAVQNAMTIGKGQISVGLVSAGVLLGLGSLITKIFLRVPKLEASFIGTPTVLLLDGKLNEGALHREHVTREEVNAALRQHGLSKLKQAKLVIMEVDGSLSVIPAADEKAK